MSARLRAVSEPPPPRLQPPQISLCLLIKLFALGGSIDTTPAFPEPFCGATARRLALFLLREIKGREDVHHPPLSELLSRLGRSVEPGGEAAAGWLVAELRALSQGDGITSPHNVTQLMDSLSDLLKKNPRPTYNQKDDSIHGVDSNSTLGTYLRQCRVTFQEMNFEATSRLATEICGYFQEVASDTFASPSTTMADETQMTTLPGPCPRESVVLERIINDDAVRVAKGVSLGEPAVMEKRMAYLENQVAKMPKVLYVRHLSAVQRGDYFLALENLLRYFDYSGTQDWQGELDRREDQQREAYVISHMLQGRFMNALLCMSSAQGTFGHIQEALNSLSETVRIAQRLSNATCVVHSLAALCRILLRATPWAISNAENAPFAITGSPKETLFLLRRCLKRAIKLRMPHLVAYCRLALGRFALQYSVHVPDLYRYRLTSGPVSPWATTARSHIEVMMAVTDVMRLNRHVSLASVVSRGGVGHTGAHPRFPNGVGTDIFSSSLGVFGAYTKDAKMATAAATSQLAGGGHLLRSAAWKMFGSMQSAGMHALLYMCCYSHVGSSDDIAVALAQLGLMTAAQKGFTEAKSMMNFVERIFCYQSKKPLEIARLTLSIQRAINREDPRAVYLAAEMWAMAEPSGAVDLDVQVEAEKWGIKALAAAGRLEEAEKSAVKLFELCAKSGMHCEAASILLLVAKIHDQAENPVS
eukprot:evm.model.scf_2032.4 EVM.evm.TU.scf_2032.4   scf_2032:21727-28775(+)